MISAISVRVMPFFFADCRWNTSELSVIPWLISEVTVTKLRSRRPSLSVRLHTSPKRTSSLSSANLGANSPNRVRPAVYTIFSCVIILKVKILNTEIKRILFIVIPFTVWSYWYFRLFSNCKITTITQTELYMIYGYLYPNHWFWN